MREAAIAVLLMIGGVFTLLSAVGLLRMPDVLMRLQVLTKAATLGAAALLLACILAFWTTDILVRALLLMAFLFISAPTSTQFLARAVLRRGDRLFEGTTFDEASRARMREEEKQARDDEGPPV